MIAAWVVRKLRRRAARARMETQPRPAAQPGPVAAGAVITARSLIKRYGPVVAVDGVSFEVVAGEIFGILGPNGAGKTTTLDILEGLRDSEAGEARVLDVRMSTAARAVKARIGVQLQATALPMFTTVREAIDLFGAFYASRRPTDELLAEFDLGEKAAAYCTTLSGGQLQRLSLALALVNDPDLVFLDEPTTGLDPAARLSLWAVIEAVRGRGKTVVMTTHYMEEAERLCDRIAVMDQGRIVALDTPAALIARYAPGSSIDFEVARPIGESVFATIPGVDRAEVEGTRVRLSTTQPELVLTRVFDPSTFSAWAPAAGGGVGVAAGAAVHDLRVRTGTLEDVFVAITGRRLRE